MNWTKGDIDILAARRISKPSAARSKKTPLSPKGKSSSIVGKKNMNRIDIKPLSVNAVWAGRRFKTPAYKNYELAVFSMLPKFTLPLPPYQLYFKFGFSSRASDWDNPCKPFQDILAKKYGFNDKLIHRAVIDKTLVEKGKEFIEWDLTHFEG